jgi:hypothetical protein
MSEEQAAILRPETLVEEFKKNGVTHIITIPDSETNYLYELMKEQKPSPLRSGSWWGGKCPSA